MADETLIQAETLSQALVRVDRDRWSRMRSGKTLYSQATRAVVDLQRDAPDGLDLPVASVSPSRIARCVATWYSEGIAPATIQKRLNCLRLLGVDVGDAKVRDPKPLKWWLRPEDENRLHMFLDDQRTEAARQLSLFIAWTAKTGLRVEETLRLEARHFVISEGIPVEVTVPGTKTALSGDITLPLSRDSGEVVAAFFWRFPEDREPTFEGRMVRLTYPELRAGWEDCRALLGVSDVPTATLKALRRTAARYLHVTCGMPLDIVRQYLRHEDINTTLGYLRLTGGYSTEEMRRYLK